MPELRDERDAQVGGALTVLAALVTAPIALKVVGTPRAHHDHPMKLIQANGGQILLTALFGVLLIVGIGLGAWLAV